MAEYIADDERAFALWQQKQHEKTNELKLHKRKNELYALVRKVIKNELTPSQQQIVHLLWYEGRSMSEAAAELCMDRSTLFRKEKQINEIIYDKLKYAMEYRFGKSFSEQTVELIHTNAPACCPVDGKTVSERLRSLRLKQNLSTKDISALTGIKRSRLDFIEQEGEQLNMDELSKLSSLYHTTTDYIVHGR